MRSRLALMAFTALSSMAVAQSARAQQYGYCPQASAFDARSYQAAVACQRYLLSQQRAAQAEYQRQVAEQARLEQERQARAQAEAETRQRAAEVREQARRQDEQRRYQMALEEQRLEAERVRRAAIEAQERAESSPDNHCADHIMARNLMREFNDFKLIRQIDEQVIDIEHLITTQQDPFKPLLVCHGVFVFTNGMRITGSMTMRNNAAGDPIITFHRD